MARNGTRTIPPLVSARRIIRAAELSVREAAARCLREGDYATGQDIAILASKLAELAGQPEDREPPLPAPVAHPPGNAEKDGRTVFSRQEESLVRVGKRRKGGNYAHRVPLPILHRIVARAKSWDRTQSLLTVDDFQSAATTDGESTPVYQVYGALKWLQHVGLLRRHGRRGYSVPEPTAISLAVRDALAAVTQDLPGEQT